MNKKIKFKNKKKFKPIDILILIIISIGIITMSLTINFNKIITPNIMEAANMRFNNMTSLIVHKSFSKDVLKEELLEDIIVLNYNDNQIISADFNMANIYELAEIVSLNFNENFNYAETGQLDKIGYYDSDQIKTNAEGYILALPIGISSKNVFFASLGPKIPVKIKFIGTVLTEVKTKVTNYGINNALIEVYLEILIERETITPVSFERVKIPYEMLLTSKIIYGEVPDFYSGILEKESGSLNIPIIK